MLVALYVLYVILVNVIADGTAPSIDGNDLGLTIAQIAK
jgi:hypothetical protein